MKGEEFKELIQSIGFKYKGLDLYYYEEFKIQIYLYNDEYDFYNGSYWIDDIPYNDLTQVLKSTRSIKLKQLLR